MAKLKLLLISILFLSQFSFAQTDGDQLFDESILHEIRIEGTPILEMYQIFEGERFSGSFTYFPAKVIIDGNELDSVGVRIKGGVTSFDKKKPLKIDFNEFIDDQSYDGLKKVNLHNFTIDTSYQRELTSYDVLRTGGLKAPRTAVAEVYYNDQLQGLYGLVEQIDKTFLQNYFANDEGTLIKEGGFGPELKSDTGNVNLFNDLDTFVVFNSLQIVEDSIESLLDVDAFFRQLVLQNIMNTVDNIYEDPKNFYLYLEPKSQLRYFIPWDYNYSFLPTVNRDIGKFPEGPIASKLLLIPRFKDLYFQIACEMLEYNFTEERIFPILDFRKELIRTAALNDPLIDFSEAKFDAKNEEIKTWFSIRRTDLKAQLANLNYNCAPMPNVGFQTISINEIMASNDSDSGISDPAGSYPDWIELYNGSSADVDVSGWYLSNDKDFKKHWKFPEGTMLETDSYLTVWADRDLDEEGLHVDFKLSKSGGEVYLSRENLEVVDSMNYTVQTTNIAFARVPNGTGDFVFQDATFGETNGNCNDCGMDLSFISEGQDYDLCLGEDVFFEVEVNCEDVFYQWQIQPNNVGSWFDIPFGSGDFSGTVSSILRFEEGGLRNLDACFRCVVRDSCEEITSQTLKILPTFVERRNERICDNEFFLFNGDSLNQPGTYEAVYQDINGCDSTIILDLSVLESPLIEIDTSFIFGGFYEGILITKDTFIQKDLTAQNGCDSTVQIQITVQTSSTSSLVADLGIALFPNPAKGEVFFKTKNPLPKSSILVFYNALGQQVLKQLISTNFNTQQIDIQDLTSGIYFVHLKIEKENHFLSRIVVD